MGKRFGGGELFGDRTELTVPRSSAKCKLPKFLGLPTNIISLSCIPRDSLIIPRSTNFYLSTSPWSGLF